MRLVYVSAYYKPAYAFGGPVRSASALCEALAGLGVEVSVLTTNANAGQPLPASTDGPQSVDGVRVTYHRLASGLPQRLFFSPALARSSRQQIARFDLAVLDALFTYPLASAAAACARAGVPYIVPLRGQLLPWALNHKRWKKRLYVRLIGRPILNRAAAVLCADEIEARAAAALSITAPSIVVPNGVDAARFQSLPARGVLRDELGIPRPAPVLLLLGRLHPVKRPDIGVAALAGAQGPGGSAHLIVAGPDESGLATALRAQAQRLGCEDRLHILGLVQGDRLMQALSEADLLIMPSESESFGNAALEAMAAGVPVLVSDRVPVGRRAEAGGAGRRTPGTPEAFASAVREMLHEPERLRTMGERGRALARCEFDRQIVGRGMLAQCQAIVRTGRPLPPAA